VNRVARSAAVIVVCTAMLVGGCAKRSHGLIVAGVGLAATVATGLAIRSCSDEGCGGGVVLALLPSGALLVSGALGAATAPCPEHERVVSVGAGAPPEPDRPGVVLTARARIDAEAGRCDSVARLATHVEQADPGYYRTVFLTDRAIARCLDRAPSASPVP
jgi:hypothetical protein